MAEIIDRVQLRKALKNVTGLTKRNRTEARNVLIAHFRRDRSVAENAEAQEIRRVRFDLLGERKGITTPEEVQEELIRRGLIPDCRVKPRTSKKSKNAGIFCGRCAHIGEDINRHRRRVHGKGVA